MPGRVWRGRPAALPVAAFQYCKATQKGQQRGRTGVTPACSGTGAVSEPPPKQPRAVSGAFPTAPSRIRVTRPAAGPCPVLCGHRTSDTCALRGGCRGGPARRRAPWRRCDLDFFMTCLCGLNAMMMWTSCSGLGRSGHEASTFLSGLHHVRSMAWTLRSGRESSDAERGRGTLEDK